MSAYIQRQDGSLLIFDACTVSGFDPQVNVTEHPLEDGKSVSDHAQSTPLVFSITATITDTPFQREGELVEQERVEAARAFLRACEEELITVGTPKSGIYDCFLLGYPHEVTKNGAVVFQMSFRQVQFASQETVILPSPKPKARAGSQEGDDKGEQQGDPVEPGEASKEEEELKSLLVTGRDSELGNKLADTKFIKALGVDALTAPLP